MRPICEKKAAKLFDNAAQVQETRLSEYWDPPNWWYPVRRSVAAAYLKAGDFARAEAEADKSLAIWKHDPMALWVKGKAQAGAWPEALSMYRRVASHFTGKREAQIAELKIVELESRHRVIN